MSGGFWKSIGSKLVDAGQAYVQQIRFINELKQLPADEARRRFVQHAQGLSAAARAGFTLTLTTLANSERSADAKRFLESLRGALANPQHAAADSPAQTPEPQAAAPQTHRAQPRAQSPPRTTQPEPTFEEALQRVSHWYDLSDGERDRTVNEYLHSLGPEGLEALRANIAQMQANCAANISTHRDNEARIAAGRFVEDQMHYRMSVIGGGPRDPGWLRDLEQLQLWARNFDAAHDLVARAIEERRRSPTDATPPAPTATNSPLHEIEALQRELEERLASGAVRADRAVPLRRHLDKMKTLLSSAERGDVDAAQAASRLKQMFADLNPLLADPGPERRVAPAVPRAKEVDAYAGAIKVALGRQLMDTRPAASEAIGAVLGDVTRFQSEVTGVESDAALAQLEARLLRDAARARHELATIEHVLIARPLWESRDYMPEVNRIAFCGGADLLQQLRTTVEGRALTVSDARRLQNHGQLRWNELNACHVAFFDLRDANDIAALATTAPKRARELTAAAYELGLAFALGKPVIVACAAGAAMPFDLDLSALELEGDAADAERIAQAVDQAFYILQRTSDNSSIADSIAFLDRLTRDHPKRRAFEGMGWLDPSLAGDPTAFVANAEQIVRTLPAPGWRLLRPAWPGRYPDADLRRCFHVMPFTPTWADEVRDAARSACEQRGLVYRRGDEAEEGRIIHAIWDDLCRATVVLVDLTQANLNVMIELGMAHAIGRPVLAVRREHGIDVRPRHIEKLRVLSYESASDLERLLVRKLAV